MIATRVPLVIRRGHQYEARVQRTTDRGTVFSTVVSVHRFRRRAVRAARKAAVTP